jgi:hypothetical protein
MKDDFHLVDLASQADAVQHLLNGKSATEKLTWRSSHGKISRMEKKMPEWPDTYFFESATGVTCGFVVQGNVFRILGDHCVTAIEF